MEIIASGRRWIGLFGWVVGWGRWKMRMWMGRDVVAIVGQERWYEHRLG